MLNPLSLTMSELLLRAAIAFSFLYPPFAALSDPYAWLGYMPVALTAFLGTNVLLALHILGAAEVLLALWILFGKHIRIPSYIAAVFLLLIVLLNMPQFPILFRDVALALAALALAHFPHARS
ncbi:hypothetical protein KJ848_00150 [Patescibacteria group bacterium]|nr:hypothetical protein [Patescibacteria group bacterium]MBU2158588.1 hypothetical protein [Patescibacteria group bacterium]